MPQEREKSHSQEISRQAGEILEKIKTIQASGEPRTIVLEESFAFGGSDETWWGKFLPDIQGHHNRVIVPDLGTTIDAPSYEQIDQLRELLFNSLRVKKKGPDRYLSYDRSMERDGYPIYKIHNVFRTNLPDVYWHEAEIGYYGGSPSITAVTINEDFSKAVNNPLKETLRNKFRRI